VVFLNSIAFVLIILLVAGIILLATQDAGKRGFSDGKVFLLRIVLFFTFPIGLILYLVLRPAIKATPQT
jgi:glucose uptake protein GlcU